MGLPLANGEFDGRNSAPFVRVHVDNDVIGAGCHGGDQGALDHLMRRVLQKEAVLESARLILIAVAYNKLIAVLMRRDHGPLAVRWESRLRPCRAGRTARSR